MRAAPRLIAAVILAVSAVAWIAPPAGASGSSTAVIPAANSTPPAVPLPASLNNQQINVVAQTTWVRPGVTPFFELDLRFSGINRSSARIEVSICTRLLARINFDASLLGQEPAGCDDYQTSPIQVSSLPTTASGASRLVIPLYLPNGHATLPRGSLSTDFRPSTEYDGTYPVQVSLVDANGVTTGQPITTYMVSTPSATDPHSQLPKLGVSWVVPVQAAGSDPAAPLPPSAAAAVETEVAALAAHPVKLTLAVDPSTILGLESAGSRGLRAVAQLRALVAAGDELMPEPYVPIDVAGMTVGGQAADVTSQYAAGATVLRNALGRAPDTGAWAFTESPVQSELVAQARQQGATELALPASSLSAVPVGKTSFAYSTKLSGYPWVQAVAGSDGALALHFTNSGDQVLQAEQFLAELAVIDLETPALTRGVAVVVPQGWQPNAAFLNTVLAGLADSPLLEAQTLQRFFSYVPLGQNNGTNVSLNLLPAQPAIPVGGAGATAQARALIASLSSTVAVPSSEIAMLNTQILVAESSAVSPSERNGILADIAGVVARGVSQVKLAPQLSVTLTSTSADVPVTILNSGTSRVRVQLILTSQKLSFHPFTSPAGSCQASTQANTTELCNLTVPPGATLLKVPVETRTSGVFALNLELRSGDGGYSIGQARYTVRSTAVSDVAVALMVGAAILLGVWWVRDRRHGRRARQLVDPPSEDNDDDMSDDPRATGTGLPPATDPAPVTVPGVASPAVPERWSPAPPTRFRSRGRRPGLGGSAAFLDRERAFDGDRVAPRRSGTASGDPTGLWVDDDPVVADFFSTPPPFFIPGDGSVTDREPPTPKQPSQTPKSPGRSGSGR